MNENFDLKAFDASVKAGNKPTPEQVDTLVEMALSNLHGTSTDVVLAHSLEEGDVFMITSVAAYPFTPEGRDEPIYIPKFGTDLGCTIACKWFDGVGSTNFDIAKYFAEHANVTKYEIWEKKVETALSRDNKPYQRTSFKIKVKA